MEKFLEQFIDGYLLSDVRNMIDNCHVYDNGMGACGYPVLMSLLSGIELIGLILCDDEINENSIKNNTSRYFDKGWRKLFSGNTKYTKKGVIEVFRSLVRHGLMHLFLSKPYVGILKEEGAPHLELLKDEGYYAINVIEFFKDFEKGYLGIRQSLVEDPTRGDRQRKLVELLTSQSLKLFEEKFHVDFAGSGYSTSYTPASATPASSVSVSATGHEELRKLFKS